MTNGIIDILLSVIGGILYPVFSILFLVIQGIQDIFFSFAGIETAGFGGGWGSNNLGGEAASGISAGDQFWDKEGGIVYYLLHNDLIVNMWFSILTLGIFLVLFFTIFAFIKNAYAAKPKGWKEIVTLTIKGVGNFILVPVLSLLGVFFANILLKAINGATSGGGAVYMDRKLFIAAAYNANSCRNSGITDKEAEEFFMNRIDNLQSTGANYLDGSELDWENLKSQTGKSADFYANLIDEIYAQTNISIYDWGVVEIGYSLFEVNYLILIIGGGFMLYVLCALSFAMVRRIFIIIILFIISPGICAMYPLDEGKAVGSWKSEFIKQVLSAYGAIAGLNLFYAILPLIEKLSPGGFYGIVQMREILQIFIYVSGLLCVKEVISMISSLVGGEDAYSKGTSLMSSTRGAMKKYGGGAVKAYSSVHGAFVRANAASKAAGGKAGDAMWWSSMGKSIGKLGIATAGLLTGGIDFSQIGKAHKEAKEEGEKMANQALVDNLVKHISDTLKTELAAAGTDKTKQLEAYDKALKSAKQAGVESIIAGMVASDLNAQEIKNTQNGKTGIVTHHTAESFMADVKAHKEATDAVRTFEGALTRLNDTANRLNEHGISIFGSARVFSTQAAAEKRLRERKEFTDAEIAAETDVNKRNEMISFNAAVAQQREIQAEFNSAASQVQSTMIAASKSTWKPLTAFSSASGYEYTDDTGTATPVKFDTASIVAITQAVRDSGGTDPRAVTALRELGEYAKQASSEMSALRGEIVRNSPDKIAKKANSDSGKK